MEDHLEKQVPEEVEDVRTPYFTVNMLTKSRRSCLEVPAAFTAKTGWPGCNECAVVTSVRDLKEWPLQFEIEVDGGGKRRAKTVGPGWSNFLEAQGVKYGSLLIFEVLDSRCLLLTVYHPANPRKRLLARGEGSLQRMADGPLFQKTLRSTHLRPGLAARLDFPTSYWRQFGVEHFRDSWFTLSGPVSVVRVKSAVYVTPTQTFCYLNRGWYDFVAMNDFKLGNTLQFAAVGTSELNVSRK